MTRQRKHVKPPSYVDWVAAGVIALIVLVTGRTELAIAGGLLYLLWLGRDAWLSK